MNKKLPYFVWESISRRQGSK